MTRFQPKILIILAAILNAFIFCQAMFDWKTKTFIKKADSKLIFPGTKWCGKGNNAISFDDLGEHNETDVCCRGHDHCPSYILPFRRRYGITNIFPSHINHCSCERQFHNCLWNANSSVAVAVGRMYFNAIRVPCFKLVKIRVCKKKSFDWWRFEYVCTEYDVKLRGKILMSKRFLKQLPVPLKNNTTAKRYPQK